MNKLFFDKYDNLYNSYNDKNAVNKLIDDYNRCQNLIDCLSDKCKVYHKAVAKDVTDAIKILNKGRNDYIFGMPSDYFINGTVVAFQDEPLQYGTIS